MKDKTSGSKGRIFGIAMLVGILVLFAAVSFWLYASSEKQSQRAQVANIVTFSDFPSGATVEASLEMNGKTEAVFFNGNTLVLTPAQQKDFHVPYNLKATLTLPDGTYNDFFWTVGAKGAEYHIGASGFSPDDRITLAINNQPLQNIPFDWSGRMDFPIYLLIMDDQKSCIYIDRVNKEKLGACHFTVGKSGT